MIFAENTPANVPPRLSDASHTDLINSFKSLAVNPERPVRPGYGTLGTPITLRANFFAVKLPKGPIFDYNIEISPKTDINHLKKRIFELVEQSPMCAPHLPYIAHDHSQRLVSARELPQPLDISVPFYDDHETEPRPNAKVYIVSIKFERQLHMGSMTQYVPEILSCVVACLISVQQAFERRSRRSELRHSSTRICAEFGPPTKCQSHRHTSRKE